MAKKRGLADRRRNLAEQAEVLGEKEIKKRFGGTRTAAILGDTETMAYRRYVRGKRSKRPGY